MKLAATFLFSVSWCLVSAFHATAPRHGQQLEDHRFAKRGFWDRWRPATQSPAASDQARDTTVTATATTPQGTADSTTLVNQTDASGTNQTEIYKLNGCTRYQSRYFICNESPDRRCIPEYWVCDGDRDCAHGEDERNCSGKVVAEISAKTPATSSNNSSTFPWQKATMTSTAPNSWPTRLTTSKPLSQQYSKEALESALRAIYTISKTALGLDTKQGN